MKAATCTNTINLVDTQDFISAMRQLFSGVTIVTANYQGQLAGLTATAVCSVSAETPTLLACINRDSTAYQIVKKSQYFAVNILTDKQADPALDFGGRLASEERFANTDWSIGNYGTPILTTASSVFECSVKQQISVASHQVFFGEVCKIHNDENSDENSNALNNNTRQPLIYGDGAFGCFSPL